jgi:hypothetical protein
MNGNHNHLPQGRDRDGGTAAPLGLWLPAGITGSLQTLGFQDLGAAEQPPRHNSTHAMTRSCEYEGFAEQRRRLNWT